jgi:hypothetical protein
MKARITITCVVEYEMAKENYPGCKSWKDALDVDLENARDDPYVMMDFPNATWKVEGQLVK